MALLHSLGEDFGAAVGTLGWLLEHGGDDIARAIQNLISAQLGPEP